MIRNKECRYLLLILGMISVIGCVGGLFFSIKVSLFVLSVSTLFSTATLLFTRWRYREIAKLSTYLREISSGNFSLDVRDNDEGELSILKNDIYKVTTLLSEHSALLEEDKHKLRTEEHTSELQ